MNSVLHKASTRGHANHGWLESYHSFSFAGYHNPQRMHFGALRVLNDDRVDPGEGFGRHPHDNMEIISIPLEGELEHADNMGNTQAIRHGDIQVMSAGTGVVHSEYNRSKTEQVKFLQIWVIPNKQNVAPRYGQLTLNLNDRHNTLQQILSPDANDAGVWIHQDAWFHIGRLDKDTEVTYTVKRPQNGVYIFVLNGSVTVNNELLAQRDGYGIWDTDKFTIKAETSGAEMLLMEVPMKW